MPQPGIFARWLIRDLAAHMANHARHPSHDAALLSWDCAQETFHRNRLVWTNTATIRAVSFQAAVRAFVGMFDECALPGFHTVYDVRRTPKHGKRIPSRPAEGASL